MAYKAVVAGKAVAIAAPPISGVIPNWESLNDVPADVVFVEKPSGGIHAFAGTVLAIGAEYIPIADPFVKAAGIIDIGVELATLQDENIVLQEEKREPPRVALDRRRRRRIQRLEQKRAARLERIPPGIEDKPDKLWYSRAGLRRREVTPDVIGAETILDPIDVPTVSQPIPEPSAPEEIPEIRTYTLPDSPSYGWR